MHEQRHPSGRLPLAPVEPARPIQRPSVVFGERSGTWAVFLGRECLASDFPTLSAAWDYIDRRELHSLRHTQRTAVRDGAYALKRE